MTKALRNGSVSGGETNGGVVMKKESGRLKILAHCELVRESRGDLLLFNS